MPNRTRKNSVADLLAKVPVQRSSLIGAIENLLKTIDSSESAVMIPTLLRDKCEFDAWELLFVAKILRASILGHIDLVEFYMNHIGLNMSEHSAQEDARLSGAHLSSAGPPSKQAPTNGGAEPTTPVGAQNGHPPAASSCAPSSPSLSSADTSSLSSLNATTSAKWTTASSVTTSTSTSTSTSITATDSTSSASDADLKECAAELAFASLSPNNNNNNNNNKLNHRVPQPPTLLNLTTNNNHINASSHVNGCLDGTGCGQFACSLQPEPLSISTGTTGATLGQTQLSPQAASQQDAIAAKLAAEFEHMSVNRSVSSSTTTNFLAALRPNSGASSPRTSTAAHTPGTPCPQAETLASAGGAGGPSKLAGDASAPVKLLLQIEQLKSSIVNVTCLLESVVELYKKSIDSIALP